MGLRCGRSEGNRMYSNYAGQGKYKRRLGSCSCADGSSKPRVQSSIVRRQEKLYTAFTTVTL